MKVWLDDERDPQQKNIQNQFGATADMVWAKNYTEAIKLLLQGGVTHIDLDHDLGIGCYDGNDVAMWIEEQAHKGTLKRLTWEVHSMNPAGRREMAASMRNADKFWEQHENDHPQSLGTDARGSE